MEARLDELEYIFRELSAAASRAPGERGDAARQDVPEELDISTVGCRTAGSELGTREHEAEVAECRRRVLECEHMMAECGLRMERLACENAEFRERVRRLRTELIETKGAVRILCRIRPPAGQGAGCEYGEHFVTVDGKRFALDRVFGPESGQADVYGEVEPLVEAVLEGYRACVFAYGQTGGGKTYTMEGPFSDRGVAYRSLDSIATLAAGLVRDGWAVEYGVRCLEVYNEEPRCLLGGDAVRLLHDGGEVHLRGCREVVTDEMRGVHDALHAAAARRRAAETGCNARSSRSHFVFVLRVKMRSDAETREGALVLVDLAGSERLSESKAVGERLRETQNINRSLSALGNVFAALRRRDGHVPFRDSKLTCLMQEHLTGRAKAMMIVNVNFDSAPEAVCSLRFAAKVSECELGMAGRSRTRALWPGAARQ